jgi:hypothetical protein
MSCFKFLLKVYRAVPCLRRLVAGHSPWNSSFDPRPGPGAFVVNKVTIFPDSIIPSALHARLFTYYRRLRRMHCVELGTQLEYARTSRMG